VLVNNNQNDPETPICSETSISRFANHSVAEVLSFRLDRLPERIADWD
jgi:hypothetical protein